MAEEKKEFERLVSPVGTMLFPKVNSKVDVYEGKEVGYSLQMVFSDEDTEALKADIKRRWAEAKAQYEAEGKKFRFDEPDSYGFYPEKDKEGNETGRTIFKFHTKHIYQDKKTKEIKKKIIPILDAKRNKLADDILTHGSKGKVNYTPSPFYISDKNFGFTLYLNAVQLLERKEFNDDFGFDEEEGYTSEPEQETNNFDFPE